MTDARRGLPSVSALLETPRVRDLVDTTGRTVVVEAIRLTVAAARDGAAPVPVTGDEWADAVSAVVNGMTRRSLRKVINATGVVLHTNLGRAPLAQAAIDAIVGVASGFSNLEYDVDAGARGSRYVHCAALLRELTGAEDALVVNNCAAALVLSLNTLANGRDVIVSRGELVEIGGSFRIPDIMAKSGARLVEVGTTNRTHLDDYRRAIAADTGALVKVHRSNFEMAGFVADASSSELSTLAAEKRVPLLHDLGSGLMIDLSALGLTGEPTAADAVRAGASVITMSGDKLLGGPQAGLILGKREIIDRIRKNPLTRSYRVDKLTLAALEATLALYRDPARAMRDIPVLAQLSLSTAVLRARAGSLVAALSSPRVEAVATDGSVGGGAFPTEKIASAGLAIDGDSDRVESALRRNAPPIVARTFDGRVIIDLRTVDPTDDGAIITALRKVL
ncbi:MAG TPA: L-seryl-tRNA(Sec) selenium transferase [Gemmatimonadaceae bacterium]|jgi:L-seryl-tRNA(Ser) seleniumtransferase